MSVAYTCPAIHVPLVEFGQNGEPRMSLEWYRYFRADFNASGSGAGNLLLSALTTGRIFVGNSVNVATGVAMSGDSAIDLNGKVTVSQVHGTSTNDSAAAGIVGEIISSTVLVGSAVPISSATPTDITSISLTAGDWDVWGNVSFVPAAGTIPTIFQAWIFTTSATLPTIPNGGAYTELRATFATAGPATIPAGFTRISIASTTTVYLSCQTTFTVSTMTGYGFIGARRVR